MANEYMPFCGLQLYLFYFWRPQNFCQAYRIKKQIISLILGHINSIGVAHEKRDYKVRSCIGSSHGKLFFSTYLEFVSCAHNAAHNWAFLRQKASPRRILHQILMGKTWQTNAVSKVEKSTLFFPREPPVKNWCNFHGAKKRFLITKWWCTHSQVVIFS